MKSGNFFLSSIKFLLLTNITFLLFQTSKFLKDNVTFDGVNWSFCGNFFLRTKSKNFARLVNYSHVEGTIFLESSDKMSDGIMLLVGHYQSLYLLFFLHLKVFHAVLQEL